MYPPRKKRSQSFLGIHFDFHAGLADRDIGSSTTEEMIEKIVELVGPDYVQCDCKGHPGWSSYPTKVGNPAPGITKDALRIWREVTAQRGVSLYMHYSGVWDEAALMKHPEWGRMDAEGNLDTKNTAVLGPYVDELLIPQLKELRGEYGVDGVWIDGDCWATCQDYSPAMVKRFQRECGVKLEKLPVTLGDAYFQEFTGFARRNFKAYVRRYVDALHAYDPEFEIASNWAFTSFMPEPVDIEVDYISGDYSMQNSVNAARFEGRCMARQGKPWDLMAWAFSQKWGEGAESIKMTQQLQREAAVVLAMGGGFQAYFMQDRQGGVRLWQLEMMKEVAAFCREREIFCHRAKILPQVGLLLSTAGFYKENQRVFGAWDGNLEPMQGILNALLDNQLSVEVLMDHHAMADIDAYPLIVIPEWEHFAPEVRERILAYVEKGGKLLVIGAGAIAAFRGELGVELSAPVGPPAARWLQFGGWLCGLKTVAADVMAQEGTEIFATLHGEDDPASPHSPAATLRPYGKGVIAGVYADIGRRCSEGCTPVLRDFVGAVARRMFRPAVEVTGSRTVDVLLTDMDGVLSLNFVNTSGPHADGNVYVVDEIVPVGPLKVSVQTDSRPREIVLQPGGFPLQFDWEDGCASFCIERLHIHAVVQILF